MTKNKGYITLEEMFAEDMKDPEFVKGYEKEKKIAEKLIARSGLNSGAI